MAVDPSLSTNKKNKKGVDIQITTFAASVITRNTEILQSCIKKINKRNETEDIHDLRVASRRVRVALAVFRQFLPAKKFKVWEPAVAGLTKAFGNTRDLDVQLAFINGFSKTHDDPQTRPGIRRLKLRLRQRKSKFMHKLEEKLAGFQKENILQNIINDLKNQSKDLPSEIIPPAPIFELSFNMINKRLDDFLFYEIYLPFPERIRELHLMRIAAKRLRYSLEIFTPLYPDYLENILGIMRSVQTGLGEIRDCDIWLDFLPRFLEKERQKVDAYFGNSRPFQRLVPGIELLLNDRKKERDLLYTKFLSDWKKWRQAEIWSTLRQTIFNPVMGNPPSADNNSPRMETSA